MNALMFLPMIMSVFGGVQSYKAGKEMDNLAADQERLAVENKALADAEVAEQVKRQRQKDARLMGSAKARAAASGASIDTGSFSTELGFMESTQADELAWMEKAGLSRNRLELQAGLLQAKQTKISAKSKKLELFSSIANAGMYASKGGLFSPNYGAPAADYNYSSSYQEFN